jgi:hypothetical protein
MANTWLVPFDIDSDYNYLDMIKSGASYSIEDLGSLASGIDMMKDGFELEFCTKRSADEVIEFYGKTWQDYRKDVARYYVETMREMRKRNKKIDEMKKQSLTS